MVIFNSYVKLPEGILLDQLKRHRFPPPILTRFLGLPQAAVRFFRNGKEIPDTEVLRIRGEVLLLFQNGHVVGICWDVKFGLSNQ